MSMHAQSVFLACMFSIVGVLLLCHGRDYGRTKF